MKQLNKARFLLGALVAGVVLNIFEGVTHGVLLVNQDAEMMKRLGLPPETSPDRIIELNVWGFAVAFLIMRLYTALRASMGAGPKTAIHAGLYIWAGVSALGAMVPGILGIYKIDLTLINVGIELVAMLLAAVAGAAVYRD